MAEPERVRIHYLRPPDRRDLFDQAVVQRTADCIITFNPSTPLRAPMLVDGQVTLEPGAPAIWFTWPGRWHDVGIFHDAAGRFTGWYANILTPVQLRSPLEWETTDLFLDVWVGADGSAALLDEDEFEAALDAGVIDGALAQRARAEADRLLGAARSGDFPGADVRAWTLAGVLERLARGTDDPRAV